MSKIEPPFTTSLKRMVTNLNFWFLNIEYTMIFSIYVSMGAIVGLLSNGYGYTSTNASIFGVFFVIFGVAGSIIHAILADKYQRHRLQIIMIACLSLGSMVLSLFMF